MVGSRFARDVKQNTLQNMNQMNVKYVEHASSKNESKIHKNSQIISRHGSDFMNQIDEKNIRNGYYFFS